MYFDHTQESFLDVFPFDFVTPPSASQLCSVFHWCALCECVPHAYVHTHTLLTLTHFMYACDSNNTIIQTIINVQNSLSQHGACMLAGWGVNN